MSLNEDFLSLTYMMLSALRAWLTMSNGN